MDSRTLLLFATLGAAQYTPLMLETQVSGIPDAQVRAVYNGTSPAYPFVAPAYFRAPRTAVPLFTWSASARESYTLRGWGHEFTAPLRFVPGRDSVGANDTDVWTYGQYLEMCNAALAEAANGLKAAAGRAVQSARVTYEGGLFAHYFPASYDGSVALYTRFGVAKRFGRIGGNAPRALLYGTDSPLEFRLEGRDLGTNAAVLGGVACWRMAQEHFTVWSELGGLQVEFTRPGAPLVMDLTDVSSAGGGAPADGTGDLVWSWHGATHAWRDWGSAGGPFGYAVYYTLSGVRRPLLVGPSESLRLVLAYTKVI